MKLLTLPPLSLLPVVNGKMVRQTFWFPAVVEFLSSDWIILPLDQILPFRFINDRVDLVFLLRVEPAVGVCFFCARVNSQNDNLRTCSAPFAIEMQCRAQEKEAPYLRPLPASAELCCL